MGSCDKKQLHDANSAAECEEILTTSSSVSILIVLFQLANLAGLNKLFIKSFVQVRPIIKDLVDLLSYACHIDATEESTFGVKEDAKEKLTAEDGILALIG